LHIALANQSARAGLAGMLYVEIISTKNQYIDEKPNINKNPIGKEHFYRFSLDGSANMFHYFPVFGPV